MARRGSAMTIRLGDGSIDDYGIAVIDEQDLKSPTDEDANSDIAPWANVPPTPPPKSPTRSAASAGFSRKPSFASFAAMRSMTNLRSGRNSEPQTSSAHSITSSNKRRSTDEDSSRMTVDSGSSSYSGDHRKPKSFSNINPFAMLPKLRGRASKPNLQVPESDEAEVLDEKHPSLFPVTAPLPADQVYTSFLDMPGGNSPSASYVSLASPDPSKKVSGRVRRKKRFTTPVPPLPPKEGAVIPLDLRLPKTKGIIDLEGMDGIVHVASGSFSTPGSSISGASSSLTPSATPVPSNGQLYPNQNQHLYPTSSQYQQSYSSILHHPSPVAAAPDFQNPFQQTPTSIKRQGRSMIPPGDYRKVSPTTLVPLTGGVGAGPDQTLPVPTFNTGVAGESSPAWTAPDSWAVEKVEGEAEEVDPGSDDESSSHHLALLMGGNQSDTDSLLTGGTLNGHHHRHRDTPHHQRQPSRPDSPIIFAPNGNSIRSLSNGVIHCGAVVPERAYKLRILRSNGTPVIIPVLPSQTVGSLTKQLNELAVLDNHKNLQHRLYLRERGRGDLYNHLERVLAPTERPADIVRRRIEQAGYDLSDGLQLLEKDGFQFLLSFVYKSQLLGLITEEVKLDDKYSNVNLTGLSLRAIPPVLHKNAELIVILKLSRNPMLEIPLDFIQSCTELSDLKLSNMAMKKVPTSLREATKLHRLDLSSNRISDLDEAHLSSIRGLRQLFVHNNRIEKLPWHFSALRSLVELNISNNKFVIFPTQVTDLEMLEELDISFNMIAELPKTIGKLTALRRFVIAGNQVSKFPDECSELVNLHTLDCRRNQISDVGVVCMLPNIVHLFADRNVIHSISLCLGPKLKTLNTSYNDITKLVLVPGPLTFSYSLTTLDVCHAKLSSLDEGLFLELSSLKILHLDHNSFRSLPDTLGNLVLLEILTCSDNKLDKLPSTIGQLQKLETLDAHNNTLTELPRSLWNCASLVKINVTSNFIGSWHDPPLILAGERSNSDGNLTALGPSLSERKPSASSIQSGRSLPALVYSLQKLYIGENSLTDDVIHPLMIFKELLVLNLSFNEIQDLPPTFFRNMTQLQEIYLSGNKLTSIPAEDLPRLKSLTTLFLNGNKLQTLPRELGEVKTLKVLDVGSNLLKYNINNTEFDWNWNFNRNLRYLNLSGNKRLTIKADPSRHFLNNRASTVPLFGHSVAGFTKLSQLRVLGLMDVTIPPPSEDSTIDIPDEAEDCRVRTSYSTISGMGYGIADALWNNDSLNLMDLVHEFREREGEAIFAIFGRAGSNKLGSHPTKLVKFLHDHFIDVFIAQLRSINHSNNGIIEDALRRTFLQLHSDLHAHLFPPSGKVLEDVDETTLNSGASGIVAYIKAKTLYVANVGDALAIVSRMGVAQPLSRKHHPYDRAEIARIRAAEGWISPSGLVNNEVNISRAFGFYRLLPVINARPDIMRWDLGEYDEFIIIANRELWEYVPFQTAVDIARTALRGDKPDPMTASQKLRDFAISYGANNGTMIMVVCVGDIFNSTVRSRQATFDASLDPLMDYRTRRREEIMDRTISRLDSEVPPPVGHLALVFTDIRNSTHLWDVNPGIKSAMEIHNSLLRRLLRRCGGYEVKTEGDAFIVSFSTTLAAVWWCLTVQNDLLHEPWPLEILECEDGKPIHDASGRLIARGLSVRMGIHCGSPVCETDPITHRMDYFGPVVNRAARISSSAAGGQIMCSAEVIREIKATIFKTELITPYSKDQPQHAVDAIQELGLETFPVGEFKLKGLEVPEALSVIYPSNLVGRQDLKDGPAGPTASASRVQFSAKQMLELGLLCLRIEALASGRILRPQTKRKGSVPTITADGNNVEEDKPDSIYIDVDPALLLPPMKESSSDPELMMVLDSLSVRISNALAMLSQVISPASIVSKDEVMGALSQDGELDQGTLKYILSLLQTL